MHELHLQPAAEADLVAIWQTSFEHWGEAQADHYLDALNEGLALLANNPSLGADCRWIRADYRRLVLQHHVAYYRIAGTRIEISRVLHERMEPARYLAMGESDRQ